MGDNSKAIGGFFTCLVVGLATAALGCGSTTEVVSQETGSRVQAAVQQVQDLAANGCKVSGGDAGTTVHQATKVLVQAAAKHPGTLVGGVPLAQVIQKASAPARQCGYTQEAKQIALAVLTANNTSN